VIYCNAFSTAHSLLHSLSLSTIHTSIHVGLMFVALSGLLVFHFSSMHFSTFCFGSMLFLYSILALFFLRIFVFSAQGLLALSLAGIFSWPRSRLPPFNTLLLYLSDFIHILPLASWPDIQTYICLYILVVTTYICIYIHRGRGRGQSTVINFYGANLISHFSGFRCNVEKWGIFSGGLISTFPAFQFD